MKVEPEQTSVFFQLYDNPVEAVMLTLKADLIIVATKKMEDDGLTIEQAAVKAKVLPQDMLDLKTGHGINSLTLEQLFAIVMELGYTVRVNMNPHDDTPIKLEVVKD